MREKAGTYAVFAAALSGTLPILHENNIIIFWITAVTIILLGLMAIISLLHNAFSCKLWKKIVDIVKGVKVGFVVAGFGLVSTSLYLIQEKWIWLGIILFVIGALLIGFQIAQGFCMMLDSRKQRKN